MKRSLLLCAVISAALVLGGCANQKSSSETASTRPHLNPQAGAGGAGGGNSGGGGQGVMLRSQP